MNAIIPGHTGVMPGADSSLRVKKVDLPLLSSSLF